MNRHDFVNLFAVGCVAALGVVGLVYGGVDAKTIGLAAVAGLVGFLGGKAAQ